MHIPKYIRPLLFTIGHFWCGVSYVRSNLLVLQACEIYLLSTSTADGDRDIIQHIIYKPDIRQKVD